jgi:hypothetical protein
LASSNRAGTGADPAIVSSADEGLEAANTAAAIIAATKQIFTDGFILN